MVLIERVSFGSSFRYRAVLCCVVWSSSGDLILLSKSCDLQGFVVPGRIVTSPVSLANECLMRSWNSLCRLVFADFVYYG